MFSTPSQHLVLQLEPFAGIPEMENAKKRERERKEGNKKESGRESKDRQMKRDRK